MVNLLRWPTITEFELYKNTKYILYRFTGSSTCHVSRVMRTPEFRLCENKDADQLRSNCEADQRLCFRYTDNTISFLLKIRNFKLLACLCGCTGWFGVDLVGNLEDRFSRVAAHVWQLISNTYNCIHVNFHVVLQYLEN